MENQGSRSRILQRGAIAIASTSFVSSFGAQILPDTTSRTVMVPAPLVTISCATCQSYASLQAAAQQYFMTHNGAPAPGFPIIPSGLGNITYVIRSSLTKALVVSLQYPMSATFILSATPVAISTTTDQGAYNLDNVAFARAAKVAPIYLPAGDGYGEEDAILANHIGKILVEVGAPGIDWPASIKTLTKVVYYTLTDLQNGLVYKVYIGDTITVHYPDGSTEKWQYLGLEAGTIRFHRIPNSYKPKPTDTAAPAPAAGLSFNGAAPNPGAITVIPLTDPLPHGTITVEPLPNDPNGLISAGFDTSGGGWFGDCAC